jgi:hypothetical protein
MTCVLTRPRRSWSVQASGFGFPNLLPECFNFGPQFFEIMDQTASPFCISSLSVRRDVPWPDLSFQLINLGKQGKEIRLNMFRNTLLIL